MRAGAMVGGSRIKRAAVLSSVGPARSAIWSANPGWSLRVGTFQPIDPAQSLLHTPTPPLRACTTGPAPGPSAVQLGGCTAAKSAAASKASRVSRSPHSDAAVRPCRPAPPAALTEIKGAGAGRGASHAGVWGKEWAAGCFV